jgi:hypothetical protein
MCTWGTEKTIQITQTITVDACIADEIVALNAAGVHTLNACCSHGRGKSVALIKPSSADRARELGYFPVRVGEGALDAWEIVIGEGRMPGLTRDDDARTCLACKMRELVTEADAREAAKGELVKLKMNIDLLDANGDLDEAANAVSVNMPRLAAREAIKNLIKAWRDSTPILSPEQLTQVYREARENRKARPEEVDREFLRASPEDIEKLKRQVAELQGKLLTHELGGRGFP